MLQVKVHKDVSAKEKITFPAFGYVNIRRFKLFSVKKAQCRVEIKPGTVSTKLASRCMEV